MMSLSQHIINFCLYPVQKLKQSWQAYFSLDNPNLPDAIKIILYRDKFILNELTKRALTSKEGYVIATIPIPFYKIQFLVATGEQVVKHAVQYGEPKKSDPDAFDPKARMPFDVLKKLIGTSTLVNENGRTVQAERKEIKSYIANEEMIPEIWKLMEAEFNAATDKNKVNIENFIQLAVTRVLAKIWFDIPPEDIDADFAELLQQGEHVVFNSDAISKKAFEEIKQKIKSANDAIIEKNHDRIISGHSFIRWLVEDKKVAPTFEATNSLGGLIVVGNMVSLLTNAILKALTDNQVGEALGIAINEIGSVESIKDNFEKLKANDYLHRFYLEALRLYARPGPIVRYASKAARLGAVEVGPRTFLFVPPRAILHDPKHWAHPEKFDPSRFKKPYPHVTKYPFIPFSTGPRSCLASQGFAEALFKIAMFMAFSKYKLSVSQKTQLEDIPTDKAEARLQRKYLVSFRDRDLRRSPRLRSVPTDAMDSPPSPKRTSARRQHATGK